MSNVEKEARRDAEEFYRAEMFFGEGAGTRRKLINAKIHSRIARDPAYELAFNRAEEEAYYNQDQYAEDAHRERDRIDRNQKIAKNVKAVLSGNHQGANASVLVVGTVLYYAHKTGMDVKARDFVVQKVDRVKARYQMRKLAKKHSNVHQLFKEQG